MQRLSKSVFIIVVAFLLTASLVHAEPWAAPGDVLLRNDLELLNDTGVINIPLTAWPVAWGDIDNALSNASVDDVPVNARFAYERVRQRMRDEVLSDSPFLKFDVSAASSPRVLRTFEDTPREEGEVSASLSWVGDRFAFNLQGTYAHNPFDGDEVRPDGSYVGVALGNWMLSAGWMDRWFGPGRDGSNILGTNARPFPSIGIQRNASTPFETKWLRWIGPWTLTSFVGQLDDDRAINDALIWGFRFSFRPIDTLEIGLSRTAQWCGDDRPCDLKTFLRLLNGNDNRGANVDPEDEPGNQLAGFDARWVLPRDIPVALYIQWTAEDTRRTGFSLHQWLRQGGVEFWGKLGGASHRTYVEISDTAARFGSVGETSISPNAAYNHSIYLTGYRYKGRSMGHSMDGNGKSYSIGSTFVQESGHSWNLSIRNIRINRLGIPGVQNSLSPTPQELNDIQVSHERLFWFGRVYIGLGYRALEDDATSEKTSETIAFLRWSSY